MQVIHPDLQKPVQVVGAIARHMATKRFLYDAGPPAKYLIFSPKDVDCKVTLNSAGAENITVAGETVTIDFVQAVSTLASLQALIAGDAAAAALIDLTGDAGTLPVTFAGGTKELFELRPVSTSLMFVIDDDGNVVPFSGDSISVTVNAVMELDNAYEMKSVDLGVLRAGLTEVWAGSARTLIIWELDGDCSISFDAASNEIPLKSRPVGDRDGWSREYVKIFVKNVAQVGKTLLMYIGKKV